MSEESITLSVCELYNDGKEHDEKIITICLKDNNEILSQYGYAYMINDLIHDYAILLLIFKKLYGFTIGMNGFVIKWDNASKHKGFIHWAGPRPPACQIGGNWWSLKKI